MVTGWKWIALVLALGMDTLMISTSLGMSGLRGRVKVALMFALAEALMPAVGFLVGQGFGGVLGKFGPWVGAGAVILVGAWLLFEDDDEAEELVEKLEAAEQSDGAKSTRSAGLRGMPLFLMALAISLDELAVGFSMDLGAVGRLDACGAWRAGVRLHLDRADVWPPLAPSAR